jgi:uncharacterized protein
MLRTDEKKWYRQFWPWFLIALPASVIVACFYTFYLILHNPLSMVKQDYYQEGLTINKNIDELKRAKQLGLLAKIRLQENRTLHLELTPAESINTAASLTLQFNHPVDDSKDLSFVLHIQPDHSFNTDTLTALQWQLLGTEKHWYLQLQSTGADPTGKTKTDWIMQGETDQDNISHITLGASSG